MTSKKKILLGLGTVLSTVGLAVGLGVGLAKQHSPEPVVIKDEKENPEPKETQLSGIDKIKEAIKRKLSEFNGSVSRTPFSDSEFTPNLEVLGMGFNKEEEERTFHIRVEYGKETGLYGVGAHFSGEEGGTLIPQPDLTLDQAIVLIENYAHGEHDGNTGSFEQKI